MDKCIPLLNKLQAVQTKAHIRKSTINLPEIVVVGTQSSGKSSVLESFVGYPFLPRGTGIVTRRPLILQLVQIYPETERPDNAEDSPHWARFDHDHRVLTDFNDVLKEIERETDRLAGRGKGISDQPIILTVYSEKVVSLTVVDLPGLTKVPVGEQPEDIEHQIRDMVMERITNENSIILAVSAANTDMATSEAVKLAKEVDPSGERTLAVITKLDLMDAGTDATDCLEGRVIPVKLGIIGVVNRSQQDINDNKSIEDALRDETNFLERSYPSVARVNGTSYLAKTLSKLLINHIYKSVPELKHTISQQINSNRQKLLTLGEEIINPHQTTLDILNKFSHKYCNAVNGSSKYVDTTKLNGGARIAGVFRKVFRDAIDDVKPLENLGSRDMVTAMRNAAGIKKQLHVPQNVFESLVREQLSLLEWPSTTCVELVYQEMRKIIAICEEELKTELSRFPNLNKRIREVVMKLLEERLKSSQEKVNDLINMEKAFVDISHPEFEKALKNIKYSLSSSSEENSIQTFEHCTRNEASRPKKKNNSNMNPVKIFEDMMTGYLNDITSQDNQDICDLELLIDSYFRIIRRDIKDKVPKTVMLSLINYVEDNLNKILVETLYRTDDTTLLEENPLVAEERKRLVRLLETLQESADILDDFGAGVDFALP